MRCQSVILTPLLLAAAPSHTSSEALMDRIEATVQLPKGAWPLDEYGRYYAYSKPGEVLAIYLVPAKPLPKNLLKAGNRRWMGDAGDMPMILDGGCTQVTIRSDVATNHFLSIFCNGVA